MLLGRTWQRFCYSKNHLHCTHRPGGGNAYDLSFIRWPPLPKFAVRQEEEEPLSHGPSRPVECVPLSQVSPAGRNKRCFSQGFILKRPIALPTFVQTNLGVLSTRSRQVDITFCDDHSPDFRLPFHIAHYELELRSLAHHSPAFTGLAE